MSSIRTLRRIQIIVAMMMILSMVVGSPAAQAAVYGPNLPTSASDPGLLSDADSGAGPRVNRGSSAWVTFANPVNAGQTVLGVEVQVRGRRVPGDRSVNVLIRGGQSGTSTLTSSLSWDSSWTTHPYTNSEDDALRQYVQARAGDSSISLNVYNSGGSSSSRRIDIDWVKLIVTTAEPTVAPPEIVGNCAPANIHLVVDNSASIGTSRLGDMKSSIKDFMATVEEAIPGTNWNVTRFWSDGRNLDTDRAASSGWYADPDASGGPKAFVDGMVSSGYTPTALGIETARSDGLGPNAGSHRPQIMIVLTDGAPNRPLSGTPSGFLYYQGAADAIWQADLARTAGWSTLVVAIDPGSPSPNVPGDPYTDNVYRGLAGTDVSGPAGNLIATEGFARFGQDLIDVLLTGCAIDLEKEVDQDVVFPGTEVTYTYTVSNPMSVNLTNIALEDDKCDGIEGPTGTGSGDGVLNPGEIWQYTCSQAVSVDTVNTAVVTGTTPLGTTVGDQDTAEVTVVEAAIEVVKTADPLEVNPGDTVTYNYIVTNTGAVTLTNVVLDDDKLGTITLDDTVLDPGESTTGSQTYTVLGSDTSPIVNTATVTGTATVGEATMNVHDDAAASVRIIAPGSITIVKDADPEGSQSFGFTSDVPTYASFNLVDDGTSSDRITMIAAPGTYTVTETVPGGWMLTAIECQKAAGSDSMTEVSGDGVTIGLVEGDNVTCTFSNRKPAIEVVKTASPTEANVGDTVTYNYVVTNTGTMTLTNVVLDDDKLGSITLGDTVLDPGESTTGSETYTVLGSDTSAIVNTAYVTGTATVGEVTMDVNDDDDASVRIIAPGSITIIKDAAPEGGQSFGFTSDVPTYASFNLVDDGSGSDRVTMSAAPGTYTVTETVPGGWMLTEMECRVVSVPGPSVATAAPQFRYGDSGVELDLDEGESVECTFSNRKPAIQVVKTADVMAAYPGDVVTYSYVVMNTGAMPLSGITLVDDKLGGITLGVTDLNPGASTTGSKTYTVLGSDTSPIVNTAYVTGTASVGEMGMHVTDDDEATVYVNRPGTITIIKDAAGDGMAEFGFTLDLGESVARVLPRDGDLPAQFTLKGGESKTYELEPGNYYTIAETSMPDGWVLVDIDCVVEGGEEQPRVSDSDDVTNGTGGYLGEGDSVTCTFSNRLPTLTLTKEVATSAAGPWQKDVTVQVGSDIYYRLTVANSGNAPLSNPVVNDPALSAFGCELAETLEPGASDACVIGPVAAQAGEHVNTAQAMAVFGTERPQVVALAAVADGQTIYSNEDSATYTGVAPGLTVAKSVTPAVAEPGETVEYTLAYANTGTMDLTGVTITDTPDWTYVASVAVGEDTYTSGSITWAIGELAAGASGSVTYEAALADEGAFALGQTAVDNVAAIDSDQTEPAQDEATVTVTRLVAPEPGLSIEKVGSTATAHIGDTVGYTITVENTGNITLTNVTVVDAKLAINENLGELAPGASAQVTGEYLVSEEDLEGVVNTATADSDQTDPVEDTWTVQVVSGPALSIEKVGSTAVAKPGDTVDYTITVKNVGDVTLTNVTIVDAKLDIDETIDELAPGASAQVTGKYVVTEADLDGIVNTASADSDQTEPVEDTWTVDVTMQPGLVIVKTVNVETAEVGDVITYTLTVTNIGDVALTAVTISDPMLGIVHNIGGLAVGESARMEVPYTVTASDVGGIHNVATVTGKDPAGEELTDDDDATVVVERQYEQPPTPVPCVRADVAVVIYGGWNDIPVKAWVGGTEQDTLYTAVDSFGQQQVMWTFYPPEATSWSVRVEPQTPAGKDPARWQYELVRIESPSQGTENNNPGSPTVSIRRCNQYVLYFQLMDNGTSSEVAPTPPSEPGLPVTGSGPEPILAGGAGLFAALSGLGWTIRRRRNR